MPRRVHKQVKLTQGLEAGWWELQVARVIKVESLLRARRGWVKADKGQRWRGRSEGGASWAGRTVAAAKRNRNNGRIQDSCDRRLRGKEAGWNAGLHHVSSLCLRFILTRIFPSGNKTTLASNLTPNLTSKLTSKLTFLPTSKPTSKLTPKLTSVDFDVDLEVDSSTAQTYSKHTKFDTWQRSSGYYLARQLYTHTQAPMASESLPTAEG